MSKQRNKDEITSNKNDSIHKLDTMLENFINDPTGKLLKKADLISYWIKSFVLYINSEETFDSTRLIKYKRGDVIRINFGFNIGKEFGGLHYAVVIDNDNKHNADVLTVVPLSSTDGKQIHQRNVDLGSELYTKISNVQLRLISNAEEQLKEIKKIEATLSNTLELLASTDISVNNSIACQKIESVSQAKSDLIIKRNKIQKSINKLKRNEQEIAKLKYGGMAIPNQIRTLSKQRIYTPKRSEDFLYGISLSSSAMDRIDHRLKELFIFK